MRIVVTVSRSVSPVYKFIVAVHLPLPPVHTAWSRLTRIGSVIYQRSPPGCHCKGLGTRNTKFIEKAFRSDSSHLQNMPRGQLIQEKVHVSIYPIHLSFPAKTLFLYLQIYKEAPTISFMLHVHYTPVLSQFSPAQGGKGPQAYLSQCVFQHTP